MLKRKIIVIAGGVLIVLAVVLLVVFLVTRGDSPAATPEEDPLTNRSAPLIICLDPGHGGSDPGSLSTDETRMEKDDNLALALAVKDYLEKAIDSINALSTDEEPREISIIMTRADDSYPDLSQRCDFANQNKASLFVSLHRNKGGGRGVEVWVKGSPSKTEKALGNAIIQELMNTEISKNRGLKYGTAKGVEYDYKVNADTLMPSCIVEMGFLDSDEDNSLFDLHMADYAAAIAKAIMTVANIK